MDLKNDDVQRVLSMDRSFFEFLGKNEVLGEKAKKVRFLISFSNFRSEPKNFFTGGKVFTKFHFEPKNDPKIHRSNIF